MSSKQSQFEKASQEDRESIVSEFVFFLRNNKKWWLLPILLLFGLLGILLGLGATGIAPFIYTLF